MKDSHKITERLITRFNISRITLRFTKHDMFLTVGICISRNPNKRAEVCRRNWRYCAKRANVGEHGFLIRFLEYVRHAVKVKHRNVLIKVYTLCNRLMQISLVLPLAVQPEEPLVIVFRCQLLARLFRYGICKDIRMTGKEDRIETRDGCRLPADRRELLRQILVHMESLGG